MIELNQKYDRNQFLNFLQEAFLKDFQKDVRPVGIGSLNTISKAYSLGTSSELELQIFEFEYSGSFNKRIALAKEAFQVMKQSATFQALAIFHSSDNDDWRFSLMTANPQRSEKGNITITYSNPRRFSFFLGPKAKINTPKKFLISKGMVVDFEDLKSRFSLEVVNKEFYKEIAECYMKLVGGTRGEGRNKKSFESVLKLPFVNDHSQTCIEFSVRLIGRIIFCWFLREKISDSGSSLMPKELLSLQSISNNADYYHKILEPIFFEILNKPINSRKDGYRNEIFSKIPYLNGGLFSPHDEDFFSYNEGKQAQNHNTVVIPDEWFQNLFQVLEAYNFTIDENTSIDEELSIDPEMLGRIFENLLAEINPDTGESIRKSTGSYYTPRAIVDYMIDESLLLYFKQKTKIDEEKLKAIISYDLSDDTLHPLNENEKKDIVDAIEKVKILDPACGSGAFPIGALQKIVFILQQIDPNGQIWFHKQIEHTSPEIRRVIEREFSHENFDYIRKLGVIRENIYGIDIQPIATEISRLRCFLTLVVDERIDDTQENRGIEPLPNLDFKFVTSNSLIGLPTSNNTKQIGLFEDTEGIAELREIRDMFFTASGAEREHLKLQFVQIQNKMFQRLISENRRGHAELTQMLTTWDPFGHKSSQWFDPEWMFGIKNGFDIVIANPPYDVYQGDKKEDIDTIKKLDIYSLAKGGKLNMYKLFLAKSSQLQKEGGIICEIFQNSFLADNAAKNIRKYFLTEQQIVRIDSFPERDDHRRRVFEAVKMSVCILAAVKNKLNDYPFKLYVWESKEMGKGHLVDYDLSEIHKIDSNSYQIPLLKSEEKSLFSKLYAHPHAPISCIEGELNMTFHKDYFTQDSSMPKIIKGAAVQRYRLTDNLSQGEIEYLDKDKYLKDFGSSKKSQHFRSDRLAMQGITGVDDNRRLIMALVPSGMFCANSCNYIISNSSSYTLHFLLGLFNSKLTNWLFKKTSTNSNVNCYEIENLPVPQINDKNNVLVAKIENLVKELLNKEIDLNDSSSIEVIKNTDTQIDRLIYDLYELNDDDRAIIEASIL